LTLLIGTPYWIDVQLAAITAGTALIANLTIIAIKV
jgi:hypothetical protein